MKKSVTLFWSTVALLSFALPTLADQITLPNPLCPNGPGSQGCIPNLVTLITTVTNYIFTIIGILAILMFVISGIYFVISAGDQGKIKRAKDIAIWAAVGAAIAIAGTGLVGVIKAVVGTTPPP